MTDPTLLFVIALAALAARLTIVVERNRWNRLHPPAAAPAPPAIPVYPAEDAGEIEGPDALELTPADAAPWREARAAEQRTTTGPLNP